MYHWKLVCLMSSYKQVKAKAITLHAKVAYSKASLPCQFKFGLFFFLFLSSIASAASFSCLSLKVKVLILEPKESLDKVLAP